MVVNYKADNPCIFDRVCSHHGVLQEAEEPFSLEEIQDRIVQHDLTCENNAKLCFM